MESKHVLHFVRSYFHFIFFNSYFSFLFQFYYSVIAVTLATVLQEESQYLAGNRSLPKSNSVLEPEVSPGKCKMEKVLFTTICLKKNKRNIIFRNVKIKPRLQLLSFEIKFPIFLRTIMVWSNFSYCLLKYSPTFEWWIKSFSTSSMKGKIKRGISIISRTFNPLTFTTCTHVWFLNSLYYRYLCRNIKTIVEFTIYIFV